MANNKMLIDATHPEETRVVVTRGNRVEEFDFESAQRKQLRGNIYLAKVTRVEPSLQAAFIEYGGNRHGFLAFSEIHPDYYQIPVADRQALIEEEERAARAADDEVEHRPNRRRGRHRSARRRGGDSVRSTVIEADASSPIDQPQPPSYDHDTAQGPSSEGDQPYTESARAADEQALHAALEQSASDHAVDHYHDGGTPSLPDRDDASSLPDFVAQPDAGAEPVRHSADLLPHPFDLHDRDSTAGSTDASADDDARRDDGLSADEDGDDTARAPTDETPHAETQGEDAVARAGHVDGDDDDDDEDDEAEEEVVESVGGADALEEVPERTFRSRRQYKIQEVIKRRQVMLVQVVKEERGNKGAALTTYLSLAGRYSVLMPNTARGGGISRKITGAQDRARLKDVVQDLDVPEGMGIILRTAGAARSKPEIKRDFEYLLRMWETVRDFTLRSQAPTLVYEEGSLIKRSIRDLYNKDIEEILVAGEGGYTEAREFMGMLMPSHVRMVKLYRDGQPLFSRMGVETQLDAMFSPTVQLKSGGYIVINQTEALVSIDVNSGRATREHHIEDTALKTNLEASEEIARQLRLRDLAGLIVIDFIDMDEKRNNRAVERRLSDCLKHDRARIQVGRISHFGLLEMSRQRIRTSVLESSTEPCPHCGGSGHVRSVASVALQLLRSIEETLMKGATHNLVARTRTDVALYVLNHKRAHLRDLEESFKVAIAIVADATITGHPAFVIGRGDQIHTLEAAKNLIAVHAAANAAAAAAEDDLAYEGEVEADAEAETESSESDNGDGDVRRGRRRRRGRRGARRLESETGIEDSVPDQAFSEDEVEAELGNDAGEDDETGEEPADDGAEAERDTGRGDGDKRRRRRGRRGGRRRRNNEEGSVAAIAEELAHHEADDFDNAVSALKDDRQSGPRAADPASAALEPADNPNPDYPAARTADAAGGGTPVASADAAPNDDRPKRRSTVRVPVSALLGASASPEPGAGDPTHSPANTVTSEPAGDAEPAAAPAVSESEAEAPQPRRAGWWSRRFSGD